MNNKRFIALLGIGHTNAHVVRAWANYGCWGKQLYYVVPAKGQHSRMDGVAALDPSHAHAHSTLIFARRVFFSRSVMFVMRRTTRIESLRSENVDGSDELYDHDVDPNEWYNLAEEGRYAEVIALHSKWLPASEAKQVPDLKRPEPRIEVKR